MKADKVRELDDNELRNQVRTSEEQMFRLKFQMQLGQADGLKKYRQMRKDRARMLTVLRERNVDVTAAPAPQQQSAQPVAEKKQSRMSRFFRRAKKG